MAFAKRYSTSNSYNWKTRRSKRRFAFTKAGHESKVNMLNVVQEKSRGGEISDENLEIVKSLAQRMLDMLDLSKKT